MMSLKSVLSRMALFARKVSPSTEIDDNYDTYVKANKLVSNGAPSVQLMIDVMTELDYTRWCVGERKNGSDPYPSRPGKLHVVCIGVTPKNASATYDMSFSKQRLSHPIIGFFSERAHMSQIAKAMITSWIIESHKENSIHRILTPMVRSRIDGMETFRRYDR